MAPRCWDPPVTSAPLLSARRKPGRGVSSCLTCPRSSRRTTSGGPCPTSSTRRWPRRSGAAFVQTLRAPGTSADTRRDRARHARLRPGAGRRVRRRRHAAEGADVIEVGLGSTDLLYYASGTLGPARRDVHRQPQPGAVQRHQAVPRRAPGRSGRTAAWPRSASGRRRCWTARRRRPARRRARSSSRDLLADYAAHLRTLVDLLGHPAAEGGRRRRQRHGRLHRAGRARRRGAAGAAAGRSCRSTSSWTARSPTTRPTRWSRRTWSTCRRAVREHGADLGLAFDGDADRCFVVDERRRAGLAVARSPRWSRPGSWPSTRAPRSSTT